MPKILKFPSLSLEDLNTPTLSTTSRDTKWRDTGYGKDSWQLVSLRKWLNIVLAFSEPFSVSLLLVGRNKKLYAYQNQL